MSKLYKKLNFDLKEIVDYHIWHNVKQVIPKEELLFRRVRLSLLQCGIDWDIYDKKIIEFLCYEIIRPNVYIKFTKCLENYIMFLEKDINNFDYDFLLYELYFLINDWVDINIYDNNSIEKYSLKLGFNTHDIIDYFNSIIEESFEFEEYRNFMFCWYLTEMIEDLILFQHYTFTEFD